MKKDEHDDDVVDQVLSEMGVYPGLLVEGDEGFWCPFVVELKPDLFLAGVVNLDGGIAYSDRLWPTLDDASHESTELALTMGEPV